MDINAILKNTPYIVIFIAFILFIIGFSIKEKKIRIKESLDVKKVLLNIFYKLCNKIYNPDKEFTQNIVFDLKHLNPNFTIYRFFALQILVILIAAISCVVISLTNISYKEKEILGISHLEIASKQYTKEHELYYQQFKLIEENYKIENIIFSADPRATMYEMADFLLIYTTIDNYTEAVSVALKLFYDLQEIYAVRQLKVLPLLIIVLSLLIIILSFFFIKVVLTFKLQKYERDLPLLKTTTFLLGSLALPVQNIMSYLSTISPTYNYLFKESLKNFGSLEEGQDKAIMKMTEYANFIHFRKLCDALREMLIGNREKALINLRKDIEMEEKEVNLRIASKIERNSAIAILLMLLVSSGLVVIMVYPIFRYSLYFSIFEYIE